MRKNNHSEAFLWSPPPARLPPIHTQLRRGRERGEKKKAAFLIAFKEKEKIQTATPPPHHLPLVSLPPPPRPPPPALESSTSAARGSPRRARRRTNPRAPPAPTPARRPSAAGAGAGLGTPPPSSPAGSVPRAPRQGRAGPDHGKGGGGDPGSSAPTLSQPASSRPGPAFLPLQLRTCSCSGRRGCRCCRCQRHLRPRRFRLAPGPLPPRSPSRPPRSWSAGPLLRSLLPSLHLAPEAATATGAVRRRTPTPKPGILPTSTIAREVRGGERRLSRDPVAMAAAAAEAAPVLKLRLGGGLCGGGAGRSGGRVVERRLWGRRCEAPELQGLAWNRGPRATLRLHWARESISGVSQAEPALERGWRKPLLPLNPYF